MDRREYLFDLLRINKLQNTCNERRSNYDQHSSTAVDDRAVCTQLDNDLVQLKMKVKLWEEGQELFIPAPDQSKSLKSKSLKETPTVLQESAADQLERLPTDISTEHPLALSTQPEDISLANVDDVILSVAADVQSEQIIEEDADESMLYEDVLETLTDPQESVVPPYDIFLSEEEEAAFKVNSLIDQVILTTVNALMEEVADMVLAEDSPILDQGESSTALVVYQPSTPSRGVSKDLLSQLSQEINAVISPSLPSMFIPFQQFFSELPIYISSSLLSGNSGSISNGREQLITIVEADDSSEPISKSSRDQELVLHSISQSQTEEDPSFSTLQLDHILSAIFSLKESVTQLKTTQFLSTESVSKVKSSLESSLKHVSSNISELISNLDKKHSKTSLHIVKTQDLLAQRIDAVHSTFSSRFDSVENKLSELTDQLSAVLSYIPKPSAGEIAKKGEEKGKEKEIQRQTELKKRPDSGRYDKGPAEKRQKF